MRKEAKFEVVDRIRIYLDATETIQDLIKQRETYISDETLTTEIVTTFKPGEFEKTLEFDSGNARVGIERVSISK